MNLHLPKGQEPQLTSHQYVLIFFSPFNIMSFTLVLSSEIPLLLLRNPSSLSQILPFSATITRQMLKQLFLWPHQEAMRATCPPLKNHDPNAFSSKGLYHAVCIAVPAPTAPPPPPPSGPDKWPHFYHQT